jgi:SHS2 domain-containing protein
MRYELLEHTADVLVKARGSSMEECFSNAAYAMFDQMVDLRTVKPVGEVKVTLIGDEKEELLYDLLSELLYIHEVEDVILSEFDVRFTGEGVECKARGEKLDLERHEPRAEIKAVTFHMMEVDEGEPSITVLFDI